MGYRNLEITVISAKDLRNVNYITEMEVYVIVMIAEDTRTASRTPVNRESGRNPRWNYKMQFAIDETAARGDRLRLVFQIKSKRSLGDRDVGIVIVPVKDLIDCGNNGERLLSYAVGTKKSKNRGTLNFSYKFGNKIDISNPAATSAAAYGGVSGGGKKYCDESVVAYPATAGATSNAYPLQQTGAVGSMYPPPRQGHDFPPKQAGAAVYMDPPLQQGHEYIPQQAGVAGYSDPPPRQGHGYPPQQAGVAGYVDPPPQQGHGYPPQYAPAGYGGAGPYHQPQQYRRADGYGGYAAAPVQKPPRRMGGTAMGLGAGMLGGLLVADVIDDVGDMDGGYDGGFDDGYDF